MVEARLLTYSTADAHMTGKMRCRAPTVPRVDVGVDGHAFVDVGAVGLVEAVLVEIAGQAEVRIAAGLVQVHRQVHKRPIGNAAIVAVPEASESGFGIEDGGLVQETGLRILQLVPVGLASLVAALGLEVDFMDTHCDVARYYLSSTMMTTGDLLYSLCQGRKGPSLWMTLAW